MGVAVNQQPQAQPQVQEQPARGQQAPAVPFVRASDEHIESGNVDVQHLLGTTSWDAGTFDIPAYGHIRYLVLLVEATGGAGTSVTSNEDGPWNILQNLSLTEPNGAYIVNVTSGYQLYLINKFGGYFGPTAMDPYNSPVYSGVAAATGNFTFLLRVPIELSGRDGLGSLANQDSAGQFKLHFSLLDGPTLYGTDPTTMPTVRVRAWMEAWDQPEVQSAGLTNQTAPPASGTTSFWSIQSGITVASGENNIELKRKGNYLRQVIFILRRSGSRANGESDWPADWRFLRDAFPARYYNDKVLRDLMYRRTGFTSTGDGANKLDNGVRFHDYCHEFDGLLGRENRDLWQPTRGSTRLEIAGSFGNADTLDILTNDVAIAEDVFL